MTKVLLLPLLFLLLYKKQTDILNSIDLNS